MDLNAALALANAILTTGAIVCMVLGYTAIRRRRIERHRNFMIAATVLSAAFMGLFVYRFAVFGFQPFWGAGAWKVVYYVVLLAHEPIAVVNIPLVLVALVLGLRRASVHREVARPALLIWFLTAVSGVVIYVLLHLMRP